MDEIIIRADKAFLVHDGEEIPIDSFRQHLGCTIRIEGDETYFEHIWAFIEKDADFYGDVFSVPMGRFPIEAYAEQFKLPGPVREDEDPDNSMNACEVFWIGSYDDDPIEEGDGNCVQFSPEFHGTGKDIFEGKDGKEVMDIGYSFSFTPVNDLKTYPFRINEEFEVYGERDYKTPILKGYRRCTVYDVLYAILFEITWHGLPEDQIRFIAEMDQTMAGIKDGLIDGIDLDDILADEDKT